MRATPQRIAVLAALMATRGDLTAQALHERLHASGIMLGLATTYRTLGALVEAQLIDSMQHGHGTCFRWCSAGHHHHLTCDRCHRVVELHDCEVGEWAGRMAAAHGFSDVAHVVELRGTCADCRAA